MALSSPQSSTTGDPLLRVKHLSVAWQHQGVAVPVIRRLELELPRGQTVAVVGASGSGKSTLALAIGGLLPVEATVHGEVWWHGKPAAPTEILGADESTRRRLRGRHLAWLFQEPGVAFNPALSVGAQLRETLRLHRPTWTDHESRLQRLWTTLGLPADRAHDRPDQFSGGQLQRLALGLALLPEPDLLIADEPTTALDVTHQARLLQLLREFRTRLGLTTLLITHHLALVAQVADQVVILQQGEVVDAGPVPELLRQPRHAHTRELLAAVPRLRHVPVA